MLWHFPPFTNHIAFDDRRQISSAPYVFHSGLQSNVKASYKIPFAILTGGTVLELTGSGFDSTSMVYVGGSECEVISVNASTISCMTPAGSDGDAHTYVSAGGNDVMGAANFTYSLADSPNVTDITPTTVSVKG